jgi:hypothetical protein
MKLEKEEVWLLDYCSSMYTVEYIKKENFIWKNFNCKTTIVTDEDGNYDEEYPRYAFLGKRQDILNLRLWISDCDNEWAEDFPIVEVQKEVRPIGEINPIWRDLFNN